MTETNLFAVTEEQQLLADSLRRLLRQPAAWERLAEQGVLATAFGEGLHVSGTDRAALEAAIAPHRQPPYRWTEARPTLEDVFIHLMDDHPEHRQ